MNKHLITYRYELFLCLLTLVTLSLMELGHPYFFLQDDNRTFHLPYYVHNLRAIAEGEFPLFNFNQYLGTPVSVFSAAYYPLNYLALLLSSLFFGHYFATMEFIAAVHLVAAALGFYRFSRGLELEGAAGCFGAVAWAFSPFVITIGNSWIHTLGHAAWLPWILHFSMRQLHGFSLRNSLLLLLFRLLALLLAYPQWFLYTVLFELIMLGTLYATAERERRPAAGALVLRYAANYLALLFAALPFLLQLLRESSLSFARSRALSWDEFTMYSYRLQEWLHGMFVPFSDVGHHYFGELDFVSHIGYLTLICVIFALFNLKNREFGAKIILFALLAALSFLWSADIIFTKVFYQLPMFNRMRYPFKLQFFTGFFLVTTASFGFELVCRSMSERFGAWRPYLLAFVLLAHGANFLLLYTVIPQRMLSHHLDTPPFEEPLKERLADGRIVSAGPDVVWDGERVVPGHTVPTLGYNFAMLWGLYHLGGYEALLSEKNLHAALDLTNNSIFNVAADTPLNFSSDVPLDYLRKWGVRWYVVNSRIPLKGAEELEPVHGDKFRNVLYDPSAKPLVYWADNLKSAVAEFHFRTNSVEITTQRGSEGLLVINVLHHPFFRGYLDGREIPLAETEDGQMSVAMPAGEHKLSVKYIDSSFRTGALVSCAFLLSAALLWGAAEFKSRSRSR